MKKDFFYSVPASTQISPAIRATAEDIFKKTPLSEKDINRLKLVFSEIFMNAVKHGSEENSTVDIHFFIDTDKIRVLVEDCGKRDSKISVEELKKIIKFQEQHNSPTKTSGRGLAQIVEKWADRFEIERSAKGGIAIMFEKKFNSEFIDENIRQSSSDQQKQEIKDFSQFEKEVFDFEGEIDESNIHQKTKIIEAFFEKKHKTPKLIVLDFENVKFFVSTFIGKVVEWRQKANEKGSCLQIINTSDSVYDIFDLVGLTKIIEIKQKTQ